MGVLLVAAAIVVFVWDMIANRSAPDGKRGDNLIFVALVLGAIGLSMMGYSSLGHSGP